MAFDNGMTVTRAPLIAHTCPVLWLALTGSAELQEMPGIIIDYRHS